jgi:hypothetical protein
VSKLGGVIAFSAEAGIWIAGAALIASAAGMHWSVDLPVVNLSALTGSSPSAAASGSQAASASASASVAVKSPIPGASPTMSPIVGKYLAVVARPDFQFKGKYTSSTTFTLSGTAYDDSQTGTMSYKAGDATDSRTETINGSVTTYGYVYLGPTQYKSTNGAAWIKSARPASDIASNKLLFTPSMPLVDKGVETKNGAQLHRLEIADPDAFSTAMLKTSDGATAAQLKYTVWVADDGTPADFKIEGWMQMLVSGVSTKATTVEEFLVTATSGVTITAPI